MARWLILVAIALLPVAALAQRPPIVVPDRDGVVLERLPRGYANLAPAATTAEPVLVTIDRLLATAARSGDARLATRAEHLLAQLPAQTSSTRVLQARAFAAQHRHDFKRSMALLDRSIALDPRDAGARLARAQLHLVQGRIRQARGDCAALALGVDAGRGTICLAMVSLRRGEYDQAALLAERWLAMTGQDSGSRLHALLVRAEAASRARAPDADAWFDRALALGGEDVRTLAAYSRHLRTSARPRRALHLLEEAPATDGLLLQRALAAHEARSADARSLADAVARRQAMARSVGEEPELRDQAELLLVLRGNPSAALALAQRNFATQRDHEDVDLLLRSAHAAGRPGALQALRAWAHAEGLALPETPGHGS